MNPATLRRVVGERARKIGFDLCGVARAGRLERDAEALAAWLRRDYHASMAWMARHAETRSDPEKLLPGCRSVIVVAMNYWPGPEEAAVPEGRAKVALYAGGRDYHKVLGARLKDLASWLASETGETARTFVDTGPVLERAWAERAGIGWIGKNANLISRRLGSWILLGEVLTAAEIEADPGPHDDFCGTCTACLDACPTGAIVADGVVDSNRCISYWTIEHRGPLPDGVGSGLGEWIFGCDDCQTVCPWNRSFAEAVPPEVFHRRDELRGLDPEEVARMDEATFRGRFSGTALMRARWDGMVRNAVQVLKNRR